MSVDIISLALSSSKTDLRYPRVKLTCVGISKNYPCNMFFIVYVCL